MKVYKKWIEQLALDREYAKTDAQKEEYDEWILWLELQLSNNRTAPIYCHHWRLEGVEQGMMTLDKIYVALVNGDGIYPDLDEEEGPSNLDHIDV